MTARKDGGTGKVRGGMIRDVWGFLKERRAYFLAPVILLLLLVSIFVLAVEIPVLTPFIYALF